MKLSNVPGGHKKSETFFRENEKGLEKAKTFQKETSAGAILFRKEISGQSPEGLSNLKKFDKKGKILYLLLHYEGGHWDFPKGNIEKGETEKDTVKREIKEETGISKISFIEGFKEKIQYFYKLKGETVFKQVFFYLVEAKESKVKLSFEHIGYKWLSYDKAMEQLTFKNAKEILKKANSFLGSSLRRFISP